MAVNLAHHLTSRVKNSDAGHYHSSTQRLAVEPQCISGVSYRYRDANFFTGFYALRQRPGEFEVSTESAGLPAVGNAGRRCVSCNLHTGQVMVIGRDGS